MMASELISMLQTLIDEYGDQEVLSSDSEYGCVEPGEPQAQVFTPEVRNSDNRIVIGSKTKPIVDFLAGFDRQYHALKQEVTKDDIVQFVI